MATTVSAFRQHAGYEPAMDLAGFGVQASDGRLGRIGAGPAGPAGPAGSAGSAGPTDRSDARDRQAARAEPVLIPVDAIVSIDLTDRVVYLDRTREEIRTVRTADASGVCYLLQDVRADGA